MSEPQYQSEDDYGIPKPPDESTWIHSVGPGGIPVSTYIEDTRQEAYDATVNHQPENYDTIAERASYYYDMHNVLQTDTDTAGSRFFNAAGDVIGPLGVGVIETATESLLDLHSPAAEDMLRTINEGLLEENMEVLDRTVRNGYLSDPNNPASTAQMAPLDFDLAMVEFEQGNVERMLGEFRDSRGQEAYDQAVADANADINFDGFWRTAGSLVADDQPMHWAEAALGQERLDFADQEDRMAIGMAKVYAEHGRSEEEFVEYWNSRDQESGQ